LVYLPCTAACGCAGQVNQPESEAFTFLTMGFFDKFFNSEKKEDLDKGLEKTKEVCLAK
jgi:hypothetical protein